MTCNCCGFTKDHCERMCEREALRNSPKSGLNLDQLFKQFISEKKDKFNAYSNFVQGASEFKNFLTEKGV